MATTTTRRQKRQRDPDKGTAFLMSFLLFFVGVALASSAIAITTVFNRDYTSRIMTQPTQTKQFQKILLTNLSPLIENTSLSGDDLKLIVTTGVAQATANQTVAGVYSNSARPFATGPVDQAITNHLTNQGTSADDAATAVTVINNNIDRRVQSYARYGAKQLANDRTKLAWSALGLLIATILLLMIHLWSMRGDILATLWSFSLVNMLGSGAAYLVTVFGAKEIPDMMPISLGVAGQKLLIVYAQHVVASARMIYGYVAGAALIILLVLLALKITAAPKRV
ncbi:hypothetical protein [Weissella soli]|uniref:hypothetical protein n=1 Tax=Weissella soli TaxID=155866 RepID=UPI0011BBA0AF|nr:hypothetical protein [Weissella soli]MCT8395710.1 hypothetical protein [Weissella soli]QEA35520.1 hypothetical protein FGL88_07120 [Weissella soli]GJM48828.1 hypothetical protein WSSLDB02_13850 [Weissella soli]